MTAAGRQQAPSGYEIRADNDVPEESKDSPMALASLGAMNDHSGDSSPMDSAPTSQLQADRIGSSGYNSSFIAPFKKISM